MATIKFFSKDTIRNFLQEGTIYKLDCRSYLLDRRIYLVAADWDNIVGLADVTDTEVGDAIYSSVVEELGFFPGYEGFVEDPLADGVWRYAE